MNRRVSPSQQRAVQVWHITILIGALAILSCSQEEKDLGGVIKLTGPTMGTAYTVKLKDLPAGMSRESLQGGIEQILKRINNLMSTYLEDSELSRFNKMPTTDWVDVSTETISVISEALRVSRLTEGAFDVTVGLLVNLWGFGPVPRGDTIPSATEIREALQKVGYTKIHTRTSPPGIKKDRPDMQIDLSAIAKGYAVDRVAEYLVKSEVFDYLVEIGGELRAKGANAKGAAWTVGIEKPVSNQRLIQQVIHLKDQAMASSGDYRNYFEQNGRRFSHTIHPRTGRPIEHQLASVTVINPSSMVADALATGLNVMGPEAGYNLAEREKIAALFIIRERDSFRTKATPAFAQVTSGDGSRKGAKAAK